MILTWHCLDFRALFSLVCSSLSAVAVLLFRRVELFCSFYFHFATYRLHVVYSHGKDSARAFGLASGFTNNVVYMFKFQTVSSFL